LRANTKTIYDEMKKENLILDYKVFLNTTKHDPQDWDIAIGVQYKNFGALDGLTAGRAESISGSSPVRRSQPSSHRGCPEASGGRAAH
jgi:hypothetical protein